MPQRTRPTHVAAALLAAVTALTAGASVPASTGAASAPPGSIDAARCEANRNAGTITYLTGFDFAAAASMVDVFVAVDRGYYDELCLDVEIAPSFSTANYPLVAAGDVQFASAGSFSEVLDFAAANEAELVAVVVEGRVPIDVLIVHDGAADSLDDLRDTTIGVKGKLPPSIAAMLAAADLVEGEDYTTVLLDGFDPLAHISLDGIVGFPGYRSNEPGALERAGVAFDVFDPIDHGVPGSFGVIYTSREFLDAHPSAAQDFVRATMRGLADAIADPEAAAAVAMDLVTAGGNPNYLSPEGETFRWTTDAATLVAPDPSGPPLGVPDVDRLQAEVDAYAAVGLFGGSPPPVASALDADLAAGVYDPAGALIWP
jgi:NitT/TauT family transport system substrate-binding protein